MRPIRHDPAVAASVKKIIDAGAGAGLLFVELSGTLVAKHMQQCRAESD